MTRAARRSGGTQFLAALVFLFTAILPAAATETAAFGKGVVWRVSAPGVAANYIVGTVHSADPTLATPSPTLKAILDRADRVMVEVVTGPADEQAMTRKMMLTDGRRLSDIIGPERFEQATAVAAQYGVPAQTLESLKPWSLMALFSMPPSELKRQASGARSLDGVVQVVAKENGIPVFGIETADEQIATLAGNSEADQLELLYASLDSSELIESKFKQLRQAYLTGDLAMLYAQAQEDLQSVPADVAERFFRRLIWDRNRRMVDRILPRLEEGNTVVAVGALHLYGDGGVPGLLAQRGYDVSVVE